MTYKLVILCALVTAQRSQSIHLMNLSTLQKKTDSYVFHIDQLVKQSGPSREEPALVIPKFPSHSSLCVASTLDEYIKRTAPIRGDENQLFISTIKPHNKGYNMSLDKDGNESGRVQHRYYLNLIAASTSKAQSCDVPINSIIKAASLSYAHSTDFSYGY